MKTTFFTIITLICIALTGCGQLAGQFQEWDDDGNSKLSSREISKGLLGLADSDGSGALDPGELQAGLEEIHLLRDWDQDQDGQVTATDFTFIFEQAAGDSGTRFSEWDTDGNGRLDERELTDSLFDRYDQNRDDRLVRGELERVLVLAGGIADYDLDGDGELSYGELRAAALSL